MLLKHDWQSAKARGVTYCITCGGTQSNPAHWDSPDIFIDDLAGWAVRDGKRAYRNCASRAPHKDGLMS